MGTIPQELLDFKSSVSPSIDSMNSSVTSLVNKINQMVGSFNDLKSGMNSYYDSKNKTNVIGDISNISSMYSNIGTDVLGTLRGMINKSRELINVINELDDINTSISEQESIISSQNSKEEKDTETISSANAMISSLNAEFDTKKQEALDLLNSLKSMDSTVSLNVASSSATPTVKVNGGSFVKRNFTSSNGIQISYYLYVPNRSDNVKIPVNMYLHGTGEMGNVLKCGLPKQVADGVVKPTGLLICPETKNEKFYYDDRYRAALVELTRDVVKNYNGDSNRVSLSGHSAGAILSYNLVKSNPGYFSAIVPVSGGEYLNQNDAKMFNGVDVWAFHGNRDPHTMRSNYNNVLNRTLKPLEENNVDVYLTTLKGKGHDIQNEIFDKNYVDESGRSINPLEWAYLQTRKS